MSYKARPYGVTDGGTGATTVSGAQNNLQVAPKSNTLLLDGTQPMAASLNAGNFTITNVGTPVNGTDAANKAYIDAAISGVVATTARVATTGTNISLSGGAPNTLDGVTLNANDVVLVKDQTTQSQNGIYTVTTVGTGTNGTWTRATQFNTSAAYSKSINCLVDLGTVNGGTGWFLSIDPDNLPTLGTSNLVWTQFTGLGDVIAGNGLSKSGNTLNAVGDGTTITVGTNIAIAATYPGQTSITTVGTIATGTWHGTKVDIAYGGTNATTAGGARTNLSAAPNTAAYWLGGTNGELSAGVVPSGGTGISLNAATGVVAVDTTVVATTSNALTMSNKTLTSPVLNNPTIKRTIAAKTASYTLAATDDLVTFNVSSGANATLPPSSGVTAGVPYTIKNKRGSTANVSVLTSGSDTGEGGTLTNAVPIVLIPGDSIDVTWDGSEWIVI